MTTFLSLGDQPPSNSFIRPEDIESEVAYPLDVRWCADCFLVQLSDVVPKEEIFQDYVYLSSSSAALKRHYGGLAQGLTERFGLDRGDLVVDIGCNDGILLHGYTLPGLLRVGVEPSNVAEHAESSGLEVVRSFFGPVTASEIVARHGTARVATATNVFAHIDDVHDFVVGIRLLLGADGVFVVEAPYLIDLIDQTLFDTIYHEHLSYLSLTPMVRFFARSGLRVFDVERVPFGASGPAVRVFITSHESQRATENTVGEMLRAEADWGVGVLDRYTRYAGDVEQVKHTLLGMLDQFRLSGASIAGYGAPAKGNTLLNYLGLSPALIDCIAEVNPLKQGLLTPGTHIPIVSEEELLGRMPSYALLLTWNYLDFFLDKSPYIKNGGRFVVPLPNPRVAP